MKDDKILLIIIVSVLLILFSIILVIPYVATRGTDQSFPPKPPIPGIQRSPAIQHLAP